MKRAMACMICLALCLIAATLPAAANDGYHYIAAETLQNRIEAKAEQIIVDICPAEQFKQGHVPGSIGTFAYPVKSEADRGRLAASLKQIKASSADVIVVCPRGKGGAKRTIDFYIAKGIDEKRLLILEKGMDGWPYSTEK